MKRILSLILLLAMLFSLSACSAREMEMRMDAIEDRLDNAEDKLEASVKAAAPKKQPQIEKKSQPSQKALSEAKLSPEEAESIALEHAGLKAEDVSLMHTKLDYDDGRLEYEVSFHHDYFEYEYDIHADDGLILSFDKDH